MNTVMIDEVSRSAELQPILKSMDFSPTKELIPLAVIKKAPKREATIVPVTEAMVLYESLLPAIIT